MGRAMKLMLLPVVTAIWMAVLAMAGCSRGGGASTPAPKPTAAVRVAPAVQRDMRSMLEVYGTADYAPEHLRTIDSTAEVAVEQLLVVAGQSVRSGEPLLRVRPTANSVLEVQKARNDLAAAGQELARVQRLFGQRLATNADMTTARQNAANARAASDAASSRIPSRDGFLLRADRDAVVASLDVSRGEIVPPDTALVHLANAQNLRVRLGIEPADIGLIRPGQSVTVKPVYHSDVTLPGIIDGVAGQVDSQTRLSQAIVQLPDTTGLLPGSTVRASIELTRREGVVAVPRTAVLRDGAIAFVYTTDGRTARRVVVGTGMEEGDHLEITSGLRAGTPVVIEGNYVLEDGMPVRVQPAAGRGP